MCKGINPAVLKELEKQPSILQTVELLIKTLLKHYPCTNSNVAVKKLLECRAKLYYRSGRLVQNWPDSAFEIKKSLAAIEAKYVKDMLEAGALQGEKPRKYPEPDVVATVAPKEAKAKGSGSSSSGNATPAPQRLVVEVLGDDGDDAPPGPAAAKHLAPHAIPVSDVLGVALEPWGDLEPLFWSRIVAEHLVHAHIMHAESVDKLRVSKAQATEPMVWQTRAKEALAAGALTLVPWVKAEPVLCENGEVPFKRSPALHPALLGHVGVTAKASGHDEEYTYALRSPLDGKVKADAKAAAPFWCVLAAGEGEEGIANMAYRECRLEIPSPAVTVQGGARTRPTKAPRPRSSPSSAS